MEFNLNKIDPNVLGQFKLIKSDDGIWLIRAENQYIETIICIIRTSKNYYTAVSFCKGKTTVRSFGTLEEISSYIKLNYCRSILQ